MLRSVYINYRGEIKTWYISSEELQVSKSEMEIAETGVLIWRYTV